MAFIKQGRVCRCPRGAQSNRGKGFPKVSRNWWLLKANKGVDTSQLYIGSITFPKEYVGKRVRLNVELVEEPRWELNYCPVCLQMTNHDSRGCLKCHLKLITGANDGQS